MQARRRPAWSVSGRCRAPGLAVRAGVVGSFPGRRFGPRSAVGARVVGARRGRRFGPRSAVGARVVGLDRRLLLDVARAARTVDLASAVPSNGAPKRGSSRVEWPVQDRRAAGVARPGWRLCPGRRCVPGSSVWAPVGGWCLGRRCVPGSSVWTADCCSTWRGLHGPSTTARARAAPCARKGAFRVAGLGPGRRFGARVVGLDRRLLLDVARAARTVDLASAVPSNGAPKGGSSRVELPVSRARVGGWCLGRRCVPGSSVWAPVGGWCPGRRFGPRSAVGARVAGLDRRLLLDVARAARTVDLASAVPSRGASRARSSHVEGPERGGEPAQT